MHGKDKQKLCKSGYLGGIKKSGRKKKEASVITNIFISLKKKDHK